MAERWLVTGALGCIGAWVVRVLAEEGCEVTVFDVATDGHRLDLVVGESLLAGVTRVCGDVSDPDVLARAFAQCQPTHVVHLAALQIPFCRDDPVLGAAVNVVGTVNVFETARRSGTVAGLVYASSAAALDAIEHGVASATDGQPSTIYGVYKRANEATARHYWNEFGLASVGLRPHSVYGPGRDQGVTSQPTQAMLAATRGEPFHIRFGGQACMQYTRDVACDFVAAARVPTSGAPIVNVAGTVASVEEVVAAIEEAAPSARGSITWDSAPLGFPAELDIDTSAFPVAPRTPLAEGVRATMDHFREAARR